MFTTVEPPNPATDWLTQATQYALLAHEMMGKAKACTKIQLKLHELHGPFTGKFKVRDDELHEPHGPYTGKGKGTGKDKGKAHQARSSWQ